MSKIRELNIEIGKRVNIMSYAFTETSLENKLLLTDIFIKRAGEPIRHLHRIYNQSLQQNLFNLKWKR